MKRSLILLLAIAVVSCGGQSKEAQTASPAQTNTYLKGLDARFDGDTRAYYDGLLELAHDDPDSRAGRKARAVLQSDGGLWILASLGSLAGVAIPSFTKYQNRSKESEARAQLMALYSAQSEHFAATKKYCRTFRECHFAAELTNYSLFITPSEVLTPVQDFASQYGLIAAREALVQANIKPHIEKKKFIAAAVANLDADGDVDIWTIDETGNVVHVVSDIE